MGIFELIYIVAKRKVIVLSITALFSLAAVAYALLTPKYWTSTAVIMPVTDSNSIGSFSTDLMGMFAGGLIKTQKSELATQFISIMQSRTFREKVIDEFKLIKYFEMEDLPPEEARELALGTLLKKVATIRFDVESQLLTVNIETKDREMSKRMAEYYLDELQQYLSENKLTKSKMQREFLEGRVRELNTKIDSLAVAMRDFKKKNKAIALDQQTNTLINLYSESIGKYSATEIEYELAKNSYSPNSP
mgnify:CR=1 FL=1